MAQPLIELRDLKKVYPVPGGEVVALGGVSLKIEKGEIYGIIGMSGAGKSSSTAKTYSPSRARSSSACAAA